jgi:hypothetical protein
VPFRPNAHDELTIAGVTYCVAEHPAAPSFPYGQAGRVVCTPFGGDREKEYMSSKMNGSRRRYT